MSTYITLQVADTRFAIRCEYPPFNEWFIEKCHGFISRGVPHLCLNVILEEVSDGYNQVHSVTANWSNHERNELELKMVCSHPAYFYEHVLHYCLRYAMASKYPPDLLLHSAGVVHKGAAYLFLGESGSGKSTVCKLFAQDSAFTILHDELVSISQTDKGFNVWSTPLNGEMPSNHNKSAPLKAAFFLKHNQENNITRLSGRQAAGQLALCLQPPFVLKNDEIEYESAESLRTMLVLAEQIPCYELRFRPERGFWKCMLPLFENESTTVLTKG